MTSARLVTITPHCEEIIAWCARESSPNRENPEYAGLIKYLIAHSHWSPFEMGHAVIEITTSRAIAPQILRHRSFAFQEFSQRYSSDIPDFEYVDARRQAEKNRQSSTNDLPSQTIVEWDWLQQDHYEACLVAYKKALANGIAREQARMLLPLATGTRLCMSGTIRSWIHYIDLRTKPDTQKEHRDIAELCKTILTDKLPTIAAAIGW